MTDKTNQPSKISLWEWKQDRIKEYKEFDREWCKIHYLEKPADFDKAPTEWAELFARYLETGKVS